MCFSIFTVLSIHLGILLDAASELNANSDWESDKPQGDTNAEPQATWYNEDAGSFASPL